jgi:hypothetical protein
MQQCLAASVRNTMLCSANTWLIGKITGHWSLVSEMDGDAVDRCTGEELKALVETQHICLSMTIAYRQWSSLTSVSNSADSGSSMRSLAVSGTS